MGQIMRADVIENEDGTRTFAHRLSNGEDEHMLVEKMVKDLRFWMRTRRIARNLAQDPLPHYRVGARDNLIAFTEAARRCLSQLRNPNIVGIGQNRKGGF